MQKHIFAVAGGDLRFAFLAGALASEGHRTLALGFDPGAALSDKVERITSPEQMAPADTVILPLPCTTDGRLLRAPFSEKEISLTDCAAAVRPGALLLGGMLPPELLCIAKERGVEAADYFAREELAIKNAVPTAEGAVAIAINELPVTLAGSRVLITGYGRVARVLTRVLKALGADVTVAARRCSQRAWAESDGARAVPFSLLPEEGTRCDLVYNTVPAQVLDQGLLRCLRRDCLIVDLASKPGGVDLEAAGELGLKVIWALSLPGKVAPETAGRIIKETILNILCEKGGMTDGCSDPR